MFASVPSIQLIVCYETQTALFFTAPTAHSAGVLLVGLHHCAANRAHGLSSSFARCARVHCGVAIWPDQARDADLARPQDERHGAAGGGSHRLCGGA